MEAGFTRWLRGGQFFQWCISVKWIKIVFGGQMLDHIFLFVYIISVGLTFAVSFLSLLYWLRKRNSGRLSTFLFIAYLALLLMLAGVKFYWEELLGGGRVIIVGTALAEFIGHALLLYYLPATVNYVIGRAWTGIRLAASLTAATVYVSLGVVYLYTGFLKPLSLAAALIYALALAIILVDIARSIPVIRQGPARVTVLMVTLLTVVFLPLMMVGRILEGGNESMVMSQSLRFLMLSLYYFWMAFAGIVFYIREMSSAEAPRGIEHTPLNKIPLTEREMDIAESLAQGLTYGEIAADLGISPNTARNHVANIYKKLSVRSKVELIGVLRGERSIK